MRVRVRRSGGDRLQCASGFFGLCSRFAALYSPAAIYLPPFSSCAVPPEISIYMESWAVHSSDIRSCEMASQRVDGEGQIHVLAVDDSSVDLAVIARLLRSSKYRVTTVDSGKKALELLRLETNINLIITDYWMPEMTGYELLKRVKESSKLREIPVVIMSSENVPNRISRCLEEGAEDFLLKPVKPCDVSRLSSRMR